MTRVMYRKIGYQYKNALLTCSDGPETSSEEEDDDEDLEEYFLAFLADFLEDFLLCLEDLFSNL